MKLFGDGGNHQHESGKKRKKTPPAWKLPELSALFSAPVWKKLRKPLIIAGCTVLFVLIVLLVYSIWEKPPEPGADSPNVPATQKPLVQAPVEETVYPVKPEEPAETPAPTEPPAEPPEEPMKTGRKDGCYTFALLASDQLLANIDTIIVGKLDTEAGTLDFISIPRDTLVNVSWGVKKLSTVLSGERNDIDRFLEQLGNLIGYTVDCYALTDIGAMEKLVDCMGGVYYNVPRDMDYDDPTQALSIHIPKGYQLLDGENAVKVLRYRMGNDDTGYVNGDLGRIATQQDFLSTMACQFLKLGNIPNLASAIEIFSSSVKTDITANNLAFFVREFLKLDKENVRFHTMPGKGIIIRSGSYIEIGIEEWIEMLNAYLNPFLQEITADNLNILRKDESGGAVSTNGETFPVTSFYDFRQYRE